MASARVNSDVLAAGDDTAKVWLPMRSFTRALLIILGINSAVALFLAFATPYPFKIHFVYSHAIGLSCLFVSRVFHYRRKQMQLVPSILSVIFGGTIGLVLARYWEFGSLAAAIGDGRSLATAVAAAVLPTSCVFYWFHLRSALFDERIHRLDKERRLAEASLKLLQAQIEPHFLFNTLSNVIQLVESDPNGARRMLLNLTSYLRASLVRTRAGIATIAEELELVRAYLEIQAVRMGDRLRWHIDCPDELRQLGLPPLLIQPLVENAIRHGLERLPEGGEVGVKVERVEEGLRIDVFDTGLGIVASNASGIGLANVRGRVEGYAHGRMVIQPRTPRGLCICIILPQ